jgi:hypothetical protein
MDETAIENAIRKLMNDNNLCEQMSKASLRKSEDLSITKRAKRIAEFIKLKSK